MSTPEQNGTKVTFLDQTGAKSVNAVIADTVTGQANPAQHHHQDEPPDDGPGRSADELQPGPQGRRASGCAKTKRWSTPTWAKATT